MYKAELERLKEDRQEQSVRSRSVEDGVRGEGFEADDGGRRDGWCGGEEEREQPARSRDSLLWEFRWTSWRVDDGGRTGMEGLRQTTRWWRLL